MVNDTYAPIAMEEEFWLNSQFSIARHYGGMKAFGHEYHIVGTDLIRKDFESLARKLGRERFFNILNESCGLPDTRIKTLMQVAVRASEEPVRPKAVQMELFND